MRIRFLILALVAFAACTPSRESENDPSPDAGQAFDAGTQLDAGTTDAGLPDAGSHATTIVVHYDVGLGHRITLRGSGAPLDWEHGADATWNEGNRWVLAIAITADVEFKPMVDDTKWAIGPNWRASPGETVDVWPFFDHESGAVTQAPDWHSDLLGNTRPIWMYLPPSYDENAARRNPVVYMHDGQNLFFDSLAYGGVSWKVQDALDTGARDATIQEAIVVGIGNTEARIDEYTPIADPANGGGKGDTYLRAIVDELKPQIDASLRTLPDAAHTAIIGSSLGGLISVHAGNKHANTFGLIGALSPSTWWNDTWIIGQTASSTAPRPLRVYLDSGDSGDSNDDVTNTAHLADAYRTLGLPLDYVVQEGGEHGEQWWRQRIGGALAFLIGGR